MKLSKTVTENVTLDDVEFENKKHRNQILAKTDRHKIATVDKFGGGRSIDISYHVDTKNISPADFVLLAKVANKLFIMAGGEPILSENNDDRIRCIVRDELDKK